MPKKDKQRKRVAKKSSVSLDLSPNANLYKIKNRESAKKVKKEKKYPRRAEISSKSVGFDEYISLKLFHETKKHKDLNRWTIEPTPEMLQ